MNKETVYYARFLSPGAFVTEDWTSPIDSPDPRKVAWPDNAYAFSLHKREDVVDGDKRYEGKPEQVGPLYYHPDSFVQSLDEVRTNPKATSTLISNMKCNRWAQVIWTRWGNWPQPFESDRMQILEKT
jgi:hypothetical protein